MTVTSSVSPGATPALFPPSLVRLAVAPIVLASFTSTWSILKPFPGPLSVADYLLALSLLMTMPLVVARNLPFRIPLWMFIPGLVIPVCVFVRQIDPPPYFWRALRVQVNQYQPESFTKALIWLAALYVVPVAIIAATVIERRVVEWVMGAYIAGVAVSCVVAMTDLLRVTHIAENIGYNAFGRAVIYSWRAGRFSGLEDHPNHLGTSILISLPFVIYFMTRMRRKWVCGTALILLAGGLLAAGSRGAQAISLLCVLAALLSIPNKRDKRKAVRAISFSVLATTALGLVLLYTILADRRTALLRFTGAGAQAAESSDTKRLILFEQAWNDWRTYPIFGAGIRHISEAHNIYLQFFAAGGVVLAGAMLLYFSCIFRDCWRLSRHGIVFARFLMISIAAWLLYGMVENFLIDRELYFTVGCVAALAVTTNFSRSPDRAGRSAEPVKEPRSHG